jgi:methyl-accepting chemotaxis protein
VRRAIAPKIAQGNIELLGRSEQHALSLQQTKALIGDSTEKVKAGTRPADAAGETTQKVVGSVKQVTDLIAEIAAASQEQSSGIEQVNTAITQMDHVVQQNASLVDQATASTDSMNAEATELLRMVARFNLGTSDPVADEETAPPRAPGPRGIGAAGLGGSAPAGQCGEFGAGLKLARGGLRQSGGLR